MNKGSSSDFPFFITQCRYPHSEFLLQLLTEQVSLVCNMTAVQQMKLACMIVDKTLVCSLHCYELVVPHTLCACVLTSAIIHVHKCGPWTSICG